MKKSLFELPFRRDLALIGFEVMTIKDLYRHNDNSFLSSMKRLGFYEIIFFTEGKGKHFIDFETYEINKGDIVFVGKNQVHSWQKQRSCDGYILLFTEHFLYENQLQFSDLAYEYPFNATVYHPVTTISDDHVFDTFLALVQLIHKEYALVKNKNRQELLQTLLRTFIVKIQSQLSRAERHSDKSSKELFVRLQRAIDQNIANTRNATDYVTMLGSSYHQLNAVVKKITNKSLKVFIDDMLILNAKRLLCDGANNVSEIAYMLGFDEPTNFTKFFKKHSSQTPKQFRDSILS